MCIFLFLVNDRPPLRDLVNHVVPKASPKWYNLGLQLFDPKDEGVLYRMKMETNKPLEEQCTEVFRCWLETEKNATWNALMESLKSRSVNLPIVARDIKKMLNSHVSYNTHTCMCAHAHTHTYRGEKLPPLRKIKSFA